MATSIDQKNILLRLRRRVISHKAMIVFKLIAGWPCHFISPAILACLVWLYQAVDDGDATWWTVFLFCCVLVIPTSWIWQLKRHDKNPATANFEEGECFTETGLQGNPENLSPLITTFAFLGPWMIMSGIQEIRELRQLPKIDMKHAASLLGYLAEQKRQIPFAKLGNDIEIERICKWLAYHKWIKVSPLENAVFLTLSAERTLSS